MSEKKIMTIIMKEIAIMKRTVIVKIENDECKNHDNNGNYGAYYLGNSHENNRRK